MKIGYITASFPYGLAEAFLLAEIRELKSLGHEIVILPRSVAGEIIHTTDGWIREITLGGPVFSLEILRSACMALITSPRRSLTSLFLIASRGGLQTIAKNILVYPKGLWLGRMVKKHRIDHLHAHWASTTSTMAMIASIVSGVPWSFTAHRGDIAGNNLFELKLQRAVFARFISKSGMKMADTYCSSGLQGKERLIHMGVRLPDSNPRDGIESNVVLCPATLKPVKGHKILLQALALLRERGTELSLEVLGDGPLHEELEELANRLNVQQSVAFVRMMPQEALLRRYSDSPPAVVVLPSLDLGSNIHEGIPVSLMEAMGAGVPVISTDTGGIPELLDGGAGIIVPQADPVALANAIERVLHDSSLRSTLSRRGRERVAEEFNVVKTAEQLSRCILLEQN